MPPAIARLPLKEGAEEATLLNLLERSLAESFRPRFARDAYLARGVGRGFIVLLHN